LHWLLDDRLGRPVLRHLLNDCAFDEASGFDVPLARVPFLCSDQRDEGENPDGEGQQRPWPPTSAPVLSKNSRPHDARDPHGYRRLTEVLACVVQSLPQLASWFISEVGAPEAGVDSKIEVSTQATLGGSGRPDMVIDYHDRDGHPRRILSEHKLDAELTVFQQKAYADRERDRSVLVAPGAHRYAGVEGFDTHITWLQIAQGIHRLGEAEAGSEWRTPAVKPTSTGQLRCLEELIAFLERHTPDVANMNPISHSTVSTYQHMGSSLAQLNTLFRMINEHPEIKRRNASDVIPEVTNTQWWFGLDYDWPYLLTVDPESGAHVALQPNADWLEDSPAQPVLYAGFYFATPDGRLPTDLAARESAPLTALSGINASVGFHNRRQGKCVKPLLLTKLVAHGGTLREQADYAATWALAAISAIASIPPPTHSSPDLA